jgi:integrase
VHRSRGCLGSGRCGGGTLPGLILLAWGAGKATGLILLAKFGLYAGGKLMGLRKSDIDLNEATVSIERSVVEVGDGSVVKEPKTAAGVRTIALPRSLMPEIASSRPITPQAINRPHQTEDLAAAAGGHPDSHDAIETICPVRRTSRYMA